MARLRFSIAGLMWAVVIAALGLGALRSASETTAGIALLVTCAVLGIAVVGAVCRGAVARPWWLGFALFGWGYLALAFWSPSDVTTLPTITGLAALCTRAGLEVPSLQTGPRPGTVLDPSFVRIGHFVLALMAASFGGTVATILFGIRDARSPANADLTGYQRRPERRQIWQRKSTAVALSGLALAGMVVVIGSFWTGPMWAGLAFLTTCGLLALTVLGASVGKGRPREMWLGAAIFGWGYMILAFGWHPFHAACPYLVTSQWIDWYRPSFPPRLSGFPPCDDRTAPANASILSELERPIPMHFPKPTPLEHLLKHVRNETAGLEGKGIPVFVDPIGLQEADKSMTSTVIFDHAMDVPLRSSLAVCLRQLDLKYTVKNGYLQISSDTQDEILPDFEESFIVVGQSLFALLAAIFGAGAAPLLARWNDDRPSSSTV